MSNFTSLASLGWQPFFQQQLSLEDLETCSPFRVIEQHKSIITIMDDSRNISLELTPSIPHLTVGDWVLLNESDQFLRLLERKTLFTRKAAGSKVSNQLISANMNTALVMCSMNDDFNLTISIFSQCSRSRGYRSTN